VQIERILDLRDDAASGGEDPAGVPSALDVAGERADHAGIHLPAAGEPEPPVHPPDDTLDDRLGNGHRR
jgi:hypothetical protein